MTITLSEKDADLIKEALCALRRETRSPDCTLSPKGKTMKVMAASELSDRISQTASTKPLERKAE